MHAHRALIAPLLLTPLALAASAPASAQTKVYALDGAANGERFGDAVAFLPDRDGDGADELLVGVPQSSATAFEAGSVRIYSGSSGVVVAELFGDGPEHRLGTALAACGDVDADGFVDFIAGAPSDCGTGIVGYARVYSGDTLATLHTVVGDTFLDWFGRAVSGAGDQDLDGHADFAVGAHSFCGGFELNGYVRAYSGATGAERWTAGGDGTWDSFGISLSELGDYDLDGVPDLIVGAPGSDEAGYDAGRFYLLSGVDGAKLYSENGEAGLHYSGFDVAGIGDADLDGVVDYAIGVPGEQDNFPSDGPDHPSEFGKVQIMSGAANTLLFETYGPDAFDHLGWCVESAGDLDEDGHPEVAAAAIRYDIQQTQLSLGPGYVEVVSSADGSTVLHLEAPVTLENYEVDLACGGDVNGDGTPDLALGSRGAGLTAGLVRVHSGRPLELSADVHVMHASDPDDLKLHVTPGAQYTGDFYRVLGSFSGVSTTGFRLGGMVVPLVADDYTTYTLDPPKGNVLKHSSGYVTPGKQGPKFSPSDQLVSDLIGVTVHHVLVVFDEKGFATCVSPPVPVTILP